MKTTQVYKYKKGQNIHLDEIYHIQGLANDWFEEDFSNDGGYGAKAASRQGLTDFLKVTKDIKFTVTVETKE